MSESSGAFWRAVAVLAVIGVIGLASAGMAAKSEPAATGQRAASQFRAWSSVPTSTTTSTPPTSTSTSISASPSTSGSGSTAIAGNPSGSYGSVGLETGFSPGDLTGLSDAKLASEMAAMAGSGAKWVRLGDQWSQAERTHGVFNWAPTDRVVGRAISARIPNIEFVIDCSAPSWALEPDGSPNVAGYASFAQATVTHYAPMGVGVYELCNEPNLGSNWNDGSASVSQYTRMLKAAYVAIKRADPNAFVLLGGISPARDSSATVSPESWLSGIYADGGKGYFDAVNVHPYCSPAAPMDPSTSHWNFFYNLSTWIYQLMVDNGDGAKKVWSTEFGYPTGHSSNAVTPDEQATYISEAYQQMTQWSWAGPLFIYGYQDGTRGSSDTYGLVDSMAASKPALPVFERWALDLG